MEAFWKKGYEATSMADLCRCTGLHKGSLYQAFGDKHQLFMQSLKHYADHEFHETGKALDPNASPLTNIRNLVNRICNDAIEERGCMMVNSLVELAPHDPDVRKLLEDLRAVRMQALTEIIGAAIRSGEIRIDKPAERLARQLMTTMAGAAASAKGSLSKDEVLETLNDTIDGWI